MVKQSTIQEKNRWIVALCCLGFLGVALDAQARRKDVEVSMTKVEGSTAVDSRLAGVMKASYSGVINTLCELPVHALFTDSIEIQFVVSDEFAARILSDPPEDADQARERMPKESLPSFCPGKFKTLTVIDFPWPMDDSWALLEFESKMTANELVLTQKQLAGTNEDTNGTWKVEDHGNGRSKFESLFRMDMGFRMPKFILNWAARSQIPKMFDGIEEQALTRADNETPSATSTVSSDTK